MALKRKKSTPFIFVVLIVIIIAIFISYKNSHDVKIKLDALIESTNNWFIEFAQQSGIKHHDYSDLIMRHDLIGIDVSHHQGEINWTVIDTTLLAGKEVSFCFVKATEGADWIDKDFKSNWEELDNTNIAKGAYHYYKPKVDAEKQSENFISVVNLQKGNIAPVIDVEEFDESADIFNYKIKIILDNFEKHFKVKPIIYTNVFGYKTYFNDSIYNDYPLWISYYSKKQPDIKNNNWLIWQNSDEFTIEGIKNYVDLNLFIQDKDKFEQLIIK